LETGLQAASEKVRKQRKRNFMRVKMSSVAAQRSRA
jgi:hypothetical protein